MASFLWGSGNYSLFLFLLLAVAVKESTGTGHVEIHFLRYTDDCREDFSTNKCDPKFTFCVRRPLASGSISGCEYGTVGQSGHYHNTNDVNLEGLSSIKGIPNPWVLQVTKFHEPTVRLVMRVVDDDTFSDDHLRTWYKDLPEIVYPSIEKSEWSPRSYTSSSDHAIYYRVRKYCDAYYYTTSCDKYCRPQDKDSGHYTCDETTGDKICLPGWTGVNCDENIDECALDVCVHGNCTDTPGDYICTCEENYMGKDCDELMDPCRFTPCLHGGTCYRHPSLHEYTCKCQAGWEGQNCENKSNPCNMVPCMNNGYCQSNADNSDYTCTCPYPHTGKVCESTSTSTSTTTTTTPTTTTTTTPTTTTTTTPTTTNPTFVTTKIQSTEAEATSAGSTDSVNSQASVERYEQKSDDSGFQPWHGALIGAMLAIPLIVLLICLVMRRRKKKAENSPPLSPAVSFNGQDAALAFENTIYAEANNRANREAERQTRGLPSLPDDPPPTTPSDDDLFNPPKPFYNVVDETEGAVGGIPAPESNGKGKKSETDCVVKRTADGRLASLHRPQSERAEKNPYTDFGALKNAPNSADDDDDDDMLDAGHYQDLDEVADAMGGATAQVSPYDQPTSVYTVPPQRTERTTALSQANGGDNPTYDNRTQAPIPQNFAGSATYDTPQIPPLPSQNINAGSSAAVGGDTMGQWETFENDSNDDDDENDGNVQEDVAKLRQSVKESMAKPPSAKVPQLPSGDSQS